MQYCVFGIDLASDINIKWFHLIPTMVLILALDFHYFHISFFSRRVVPNLIQIRGMSATDSPSLSKKQFKMVIGGIGGAPGGDEEEIDLESSPVNKKMRDHE